MRLLIWSIYPFGLLVALCLIADAAGQSPASVSPYGSANTGRPSRPIAQEDVSRTTPSPVDLALRWGEAMLQRMEAVNDYSCTLVKRERINGKLSEHQYIEAKIRHRPFSVNLSFVAPDHVRGREAVWVEGKNNGKLLAKGVGLQSIFGAVSLDPKGRFAMQDTLHPITDVGMLNLATTMIASTRRDAQIGEVNVTFHKNSRVGERRCTCIQFHHPVRRRELRYHVSRIFVDDELTLPIRFEGYTWPTQAEGAPLLIEEYTYLNLKLNNGFRDGDFRL